MRHTSAPSAATIKARFTKVKPAADWSFAHLTTSHTRYATHGYHSYPAKFIPQLAARLIGEFSEPGDWVADPFMGSGTTLVEAKLLGRPSLGVDINPVAHLISAAKTTPVEPQILEAELAAIQARIDDERCAQTRLWSEVDHVDVPDHERIDYWFKPDTKAALARLLALIETASDERVRGFLRCAFSNILKTCSIWLQRSVKPTRDFDKRARDPAETFLRQVRQMAKRNAEFYALLDERGCLDVPALAQCQDARRLPAADGQVGLVVTSPPYVTSYEYADLHQLAALWFRFMTDLPAFRKPFIGTAHHEAKPIEIDSSIGERVVAQLEARKPKSAREVATYFTDMREVFVELHRALRPGGRACIVIGNTNLLGVEILNAQVFAEQMVGMGFEFERLIDRDIPCKTLPQVRDKKTGKFTKAKSADFIAYPHEYVLVMRQA